MTHSDEQHGEHTIADDRVSPPHLGTERETLRAFLDHHRATLAMKCAGLSDDELRRQSMAPSALSLLGLVRHLAEVERAWFRRVFEDNDAPMLWSPPGVIDFQAAYDASASTRSEAFTAWEAEVENSRRVERAAESLDLTGRQPRWDEDVSLRMAMVHVLLEYGRHNGHADLLREGIDGSVGA
ncbi:DinB family protein [Streptomyces sp. NBC_01511]|uniref:DinB family protein n=1 Tax=Streptomyces sp. NBC_01511 TaxID=2903889 RepID=UPI00386ECD6D